MIQQALKSVQSLIRWFFGSPFRQLPPEFGETVSPEMQAFEAKAEAVQHRPRGNVQASAPDGSKQNKSHP